MKRGHYNFSKTLKEIVFPEKEGVFYSQKSRMWVVRIRSKSVGNFRFSSIGQFKKEDEAVKFYNNLKKNNKDG